MRSELIETPKFICLLSETSPNCILVLTVSIFLLSVDQICFSHENNGKDAPAENWSPLKLVGSVDALYCIVCLLDKSSFG